MDEEEVEENLSIAEMLDDSEEDEFEVTSSTRVIPYDHDQRAFMTRLLSPSTSRRELEDLIRLGFNPKAFQPAIAKVIEFGLDHFRSTKSLPDYHLIRANFPDFNDLVTAKDQELYLSDHYSLSGLFKSVADSHFMLQLRSAHDEAAEHYSDTSLSCDEVWNRIQERHRELALLRSVSTNRSSTMAEMLDDVVEYYEEAGKGTNFGVVIPFPFLNKTLRGWQHSNVYTVVAKTGVGKTWCVLMSAVAAAAGNPFLFTSAKAVGMEPVTPEQRELNQKRVLVVSTEMPIEEINRRSFALIAKFNYPELLSGKFGRPSDIKRFPQIIDRLKHPDSPAQRIKYVTVTSPDEVAAEADIFEADLIIIDGFYLMSGPGERRWEKVQHNMQMLRLHSLMSTRPYVLASQMDAKEDRLSFSQSIGQDSTAVILLSQRLDEKNIKKMRMGTLKVRDGALGEEFMYNWDFVNSRFNEEGPAYHIDGEEL